MRASRPNLVTLQALQVLSAAVLAASLAACGGSDDTTTTTTTTAQAPALTPTPATASAADQCSALANKSIAAGDIGIATSGAIIQSAQLMSTAANGEYCKVLGAIRPVDVTAPDINFQVNLPSTWNNKALQMGGGGLDGTVVTGDGSFTSQPASVANALKQGYVTYGSDSGHDASGGGAFALNNEALANFGRLQIKKTHDAVKAIVKARYGSLPTHSYFIGGSQGGHEALIAAQFYPEDYDGIVSGFPAYNVTMMHVASNDFAKALYANGGAGWINAAKMKLIFNAAMSACDTLDGVADGIVGNPNGAACTALTSKLAVADATNPLRCAGGTDAGDTCLSDAQIATVAHLNSRFSLGFPIAAGISSYGKWPILDGTAFVTEGLGTKAAYSTPPSGDAFQYTISDTTVRYIITKNLSIDSIQGFQPSTWQNRIVEVSEMLDASYVDLDAFRAKGGKMLMFHGTNDSSITPYNSIDYYTRLVTRYTQTTADTFSRFYLIPGFGHGSGQFQSRVDWLAALDTWVANGTAPEKLVATDGNSDATTTATNGRTRPVCLYGTYPKYTGPASPTQAQQNDAANFTCTVTAS
ncbi:tannase/feruloyl esterase family alpha/beta hydrolase [Cupriavidus basilensis]